MEVDIKNRENFQVLDKIFLIIGSKLYKGVIKSKETRFYKGTREDTYTIILNGEYFNKYIDKNSNIYSTNNPKLLHRSLEELWT